MVSFKELFKAQKNAMDSSIKLANAEIEHYFGLMKTQDPALKQEDVDKRRLSNFLLKVPEIGHPADEIPIALKALSDCKWEVRWAAIHKLFRLVSQLHHEWANWGTIHGENRTLRESVYAHLMTRLNDTDERVRAKAAENIKRIKEYL